MTIRKDLRNMGIKTYRSTKDGKSYVKKTEVVAALTRVHDDLVYKVIAEEQMDKTQKKSLFRRFKSSVSQKFKKLAISFISMLIAGQALAGPKFQKDMDEYEKILESSAKTMGHVEGHADIDVDVDVVRDDEGMKIFNINMRSLNDESKMRVQVIWSDNNKSVQLYGVEGNHGGYDLSLEVFSNTVKSVWEEQLMKAVYDNALE